MKNCVKKKMTKKTGRRWNRWFVGAFVFAKAIFRRNIISIRSFDDDESRCVGDACEAYERREKRRKEETRYKTGQSWLVNLLVTMLASYSWLTFPGSVATD